MTLAMILLVRVVQTNARRAGQTADCLVFLRRQFLRAFAFVQSAVETRSQRW